MIAVKGVRLAFTTDSYVIIPHILPGGDIGHHGIAIMAVHEGLSFETVIECDNRKPFTGKADGIFWMDSFSHLNSQRFEITVFQQVAAISGN
ncbi:MAG: hypothetical protein HY287_13080 [Planctomycetes bacterium]|nr:hypothetical protein [Planctomycetota bacterium]